MAIYGPGDWVLYLRRSQGRKPIARQRALTAAYIEQRGGRVAGEFTDADRTAFKKVDGPQPVRPGFNAMLALIRANPGLGMAAWHADRLTRNDQDTAELLAACSGGGHPIETQAGGAYDLATSNGRRRLRDDSSAAIYEVDHNRERVLEGRAEVAADGRWLGGKRPFGWELDQVPVLDGEPWLDADGKLMRGVLKLRQAESDLLAQAHFDILAGKTLYSIERDWYARGIRGTKGARLIAVEIRRLLLRARNAGLMEYQGRITGAARWPAIVDEPTWLAVKSILSDPQRTTNRGGPGRTHLLAWLATCGICGSWVVVSNTASSRPVYRCREGTRGHVARDEASVDKYIERVVILWFSEPDRARLMKAQRPQGPDLAALGRDAAVIRELMAADRRMQLQGLLTEGEFAEGRRQHQEQLAAIDQRVTEAGRADVLLPLLRDPARVWAGLDLDQRRAVIDSMMTVKIMQTAKGRPEGWKPGQGYFRADSIEITFKH